MSVEAIKKISKKQYTGKVYNLEVEPNDSVEDDQYYVCADTGIVVHNCHPRDNIALREMADRLDLGYDLFDAVMTSREKQAKNMAEFLIEQANSIGREELFEDYPVVIIGKAYKPLVPYCDGSSSMLVGHYLEPVCNLYYYDIVTGDMPPEEVFQKPAVYLIAHDPEVTYGDQLDHVREFMTDRNVSEADRAFMSVAGMDRIPAPGSIMVDPWRKVQIDPELGIKIIHYGNTRNS